MKEQKGAFNTIWPYLCVLLVALLAVGVVWVMTGQRNYTEPYPSEEDPMANTEPDFPSVSALDVIAVEDLVEQYFQAKMTADVDLMNRIVESDREFDASDLGQEAQFISKYADTKLYVVPSRQSDYEIAYVTFNIYFNGISTGAPSLNRFVIHKISDEEFKICSKSVSSEFDQYLKETEETTAVKNLKKQVEKNLKTACENDSDLNILITYLEGAEEPSAGESLPEYTSEEESESASESGSQSQE